MLEAITIFTFSVLHIALSWARQNKLLFIAIAGIYITLATFTSSFLTGVVCFLVCYISLWALIMLNLDSSSHAKKIVDGVLEKQYGGKN